MERVARLGAMDLPTAMSILLGGAFCYSAWLTSIVFCAASGQRPTDRGRLVLPHRHRARHRRVVRRLVIAYR